MPKLERVEWKKIAFPPRPAYLIMRLGVRWEVTKLTNAARPPRRVEPRHESGKGDCVNRWGIEVSRASITCLNWSQLVYQRIGQGDTTPSGNWVHEESLHRYKHLL